MNAPVPARSFNRRIYRREHNTLPRCNEGDVILRQIRALHSPAQIFKAISRLPDSWRFRARRIKSSTRVSNRHFGNFSDYPNVFKFSRGKKYPALVGEKARVIFHRCFADRCTTHCDKHVSSPNEISLIHARISTDR